MFSIRTTTTANLSIADRKILAGFALVKKHNINVHSEMLQDVKYYFEGSLGGGESLETEDYLVNMAGDESFRQQLWDATNIH